MASYQCRGKNKLWSVRFDIIENGQSITKRLSGFQRKKDAEQAYMDFMQEYKTKMIVEPSKSILDRNFIDVFDEFKRYKQTQVKDSSFYDIARISDKYILPYFINKTIRTITKLDILNWQTALDSFSFKYKSKIRTILYSFYKYLNSYYDVDNIVAKVEAFKKPNTNNEMDIWTKEDFDKFSSQIDDVLYKTFFSLMYYTGLRRGEGFALNYNDIDFNKKTLKISKNITTKIYNNTSNLPYSITSPKNATSYRTILLPDVIINLLKEYIKSYPESKIKQFLFGGDKPLDENTTYRKKDYYSELAGIKKIRLHDFRHSHASLLIQQGANVLLIAKRLGHKDIKQTLNTYSHLFPNSEQELIEKLNKI